MTHARRLKTITGSPYTVVASEPDADGIVELVLMRETKPLGVEVRVRARSRQEAMNLADQLGGVLLDPDSWVVAEWRAGDHR